MRWFYGHSGLKSVAVCKSLRLCRRGFEVGSQGPVQSEDIPGWDLPRRCEHLKSYLDEYCFRFNHRREAALLFAKLVRAVVLSVVAK